MNEPDPPEPVELATARRIARAVSASRRGDGMIPQVALVIFRTDRDEEGALRMCPFVGLSRPADDTPPRGENPSEEINRAEELLIAELAETLRGTAEILNKLTAL